MRAFAHAGMLMLLLPLAAGAGPASRPALDPIVPEVDFRATPLDKAIDMLRDRSKVNIVVRWPMLAAAGVTRTAPVDLRVKNLPLQSVLVLVAEVAGGRDVPMAARAERGVVILSTEENFGIYGVVRVYDVRDLLASHMVLRAEGPAARRATTTTATTTMPATTQATQTFPPTAERLMLFVESLDRLEHLLRETVDPESWRDAGGVVGGVYEFNGRLVVTQTPGAHERIAKLLDELRGGGDDIHAKRD